MLKTYKNKNLIKRKRKKEEQLVAVPLFGGDNRDRTDDLLNAIQTRSQLRYAPKSNDTIIISGESCFVNLFLILFSMKFLRVDKVKKEFIMILF